LKPGDYVRVLDTAGEEKKGEFASFSADSISLRTRRGESAVERGKVRLVQVRSGTKRARNLVIGVAIGLAIAVTLDQTVGAYVRNESGDNPGTRGLTYALPIAVSGGIGAVVPGYRTVYRAK
jgi:hypothetical protein